MFMRICVVGAGAIGGFIASGLAGASTDAGIETSVLARGATLRALRYSGLRVHSAAGNAASNAASNAAGTVTRRIRASDDAAELGTQDVVVLSVKAQSAAAAAASIGPLLGSDTIVLPTMNGVPWWFFDGFGGAYAWRHLDSVDPGGTISAIIDVSRVVGAVVHMSASSPEPGVVRQFSGNELIIGEPSGSDTARVRDLAAVLTAAGLAVTVSPRIREDVWYKLWGNLTIGPVSALTGATADQVLDDDLVRRFCESAMLEARAIGSRIGCPITETPADRSVVTRKLGAFRPSMLQDAEAGRALELDALTGAVREIGTLVGVPTPFVDALHGLTRLSARDGRP
jgi:2-dehydropantoate 2-reductase